ncbi:MAG: ATP-binding protein [Planctomycetota bacterium]
MLFNLLDNAAKFTAEDGAITVSTRSEKQEVVLEVKDDGIGIDAKYHDRVFERFFRVENQAHSVPGHGLGLSICQSLIELHGGKITLESDVGRGSTFRVHLMATSQGEAAA